MKSVLCIIAMLFTSWTVPLLAYPEIQTLSEDDVNYKQFRFLHSQHVTESGHLSLFEYTLKNNEDLYAISKTTDISLSTLITINRMSTIQMNETIPKTVIIPTKNSIFLSVDPKSDVEIMLQNRLSHTLTYEKPIIIRSKSQKNSSAFYVLPNESLIAEEMKTWSITDFRPPVLQGTITSPFGTRISPISGFVIPHKGIDIAGKSGDGIFASKNGVVTDEGFDSVYGYYIIITHEDNTQTLYGHILDITISMNTYVFGGQLIAYMGSTGLSTGAHIHFEIRKNGIPVDPLSLVKFRNIEE